MQSKGGCLKLINNVTLTGNLTRDAELKHDTKTPILTGTIAVNERRKQGDDWVDYPNFIDFVMFGERALKVERWFEKGRKLTISGHLHQQRWEADGKNRSRIEVVISSFEFMSRPKQEQTVEFYEDDIPF